MLASLLGLSLLAVRRVSLWCHDINLWRYGINPGAYKEMVRRAEEAEASGQTGELDKVYRQIWEDLPKADLCILLRNFNRVFSDDPVTRYGGLSSMSLSVPSAGWSIHMYRPSLEDISPSLYEHLKQKQVKSENTLSVVTFLSIGEEIARLTGRKVGYIHQEGGDPADADYTDYGPYYPERWKNVLSRLFRPRRYGFRPKWVYAFWV